MNAAETTTTKNEIACKSCGALLTFKPGTLKLICEYCKAENDIQQGVQTEIIENNLEDFLSKNIEQKEKITVSTIQCAACGATSTISPNITSDQCPFCATPFVIKNSGTSSQYKPQYILPFGIDRNKALEHFKKWLKNLWFAPSELSNYADRADRLSGIYLPFWTFDCQTHSSYIGQRGVDYTESQTYTDSKGQQQTRSVTRTNWFPSAGSVNRAFDDLLIEASTTLPKNKLRELEPWDLKNLAPYNEQYLMGFRTENYQVDLPTAYLEGKKQMQEMIMDSVKGDIGGDRQKVFTINTTFTEPTFKYVLLPVWISAYKFNNKLYQIIINARTGEIQGDRPFSAGKIAMAVMGGILLAIILYMLFS